MTGPVAVFLRSINVGGRRVTMDRLREIFADLGHPGARTFQAAGNVVLHDPAGDPHRIVQGIEEGLEAALGYPVPTFLRTGPELAELLERAPVDPSELQGPDHAHYVFLLRSAVDDDVRARFAPLESERDSFRYGPREVHWLSRGRMSESPLFGGPLERATRDLPHTMRKTTTLEGVVRLCGTSHRMESRA